MSTLSVLRARLTAVQSKILEVLQTGEEYTISGSHTVRNPKLMELEKQESLIRKKILGAKGYTGRILPDFDGTGNSGYPDYEGIDGGTP